MGGALFGVSEKKLSILSSSREGTKNGTDANLNVLGTTPNTESTVVAMHPAVGDPLRIDTLSKTLNGHSE
jgi:hypothetical protein